MNGKVFEFEGGNGELRDTILGMLCLASLGGVVRWLRNKGRHTLFSFLLALSTSAFVGMQAHFFMLYLGLDQNLQFALSGACGYSAGAILDAFSPLIIRWVYKRFGVELPQPRRRAEDRDD